MSRNGASQSGRSVGETHRTESVGEILGSQAAVNQPSDDEENSVSLLQDYPVTTTTLSSAFTLGVNVRSNPIASVQSGAAHLQDNLSQMPMPIQNHNQSDLAPQDSEDSEVIRAPQLRRRRVLEIVSDEDSPVESAVLDLSNIRHSEMSATLQAGYGSDIDIYSDASDNLYSDVDDSDMTDVEIVEVQTSAHIQATLQAPPIHGPLIQASPIQAPPSQAPPVQAPPVQAPPIQAPPVQAPPVQAPPVQAPPVQAPPVQAPPVQAPPVQAPPIQAPPIQAAHIAPGTATAYLAHIQPTLLAPASSSLITSTSSPARLQSSLLPESAFPASGSASSSAVPAAGGTLTSDFKSPKKDAPPQPPKSAAVEESDDDDSQTCIICYEPWTNSGDHRLASLKCGHLFGHCCILKWLKPLTNPKCPQCNAKAKKSDIRIIFAKSLRTIDTSERDRALQELKKEKEIRRKVEIDMAQANLQYRIAMEEMNRLRELINSQLDQRRNVSSANQTPGTSQSAASTNRPSERNNAPRGQYTLDKTILISQNGNCRVIGFDQFHSALIVSMPSPNQLFPGFGVKKVSAVDLRCTQYVPIHTAMIRSLCFNGRNDGLMLTASADKTLKMTSLASNSVVQTYKTDVQVWSCAWNSTDVNYVYAGLQNGAILVYDTRQANTEVQRLTLDNSRFPIVSLNYVPKAADRALGCSGLLMASLGGQAFWEQTSTTDFKPHLLQMNGVCTSLGFNSISRHCLASFRPNKNHNTTKHVMCELRNEKDPVRLTNEVVCHPVQTFLGGPTMKVLTRSILYESPDRPDHLYACSGDEATSSALIWDTATGNQVQKLLVNATVVDVCSFKFNRQNFLAALTEKQVKLFTWRPTS